MAMLLQPSEHFSPSHLLSHDPPWTDRLKLDHFTSSASSPPAPAHILFRPFPQLNSASPCHFLDFFSSLQPTSHSSISPRFSPPQYLMSSANYTGGHPFPSAVSFSTISLLFSSIFRHQKGSLELSRPFSILAFLTPSGKGHKTTSCSGQTCSAREGLSQMAAWVTSLPSIFAIEDSSSSRNANESRSSQELGLCLRRNFSCIFKGEQNGCDGSRESIFIELAGKGAIQVNNTRICQDDLTLISEEGYGQGIRVANQPPGLAVGNCGEQEIAGGGAESLRASPGAALQTSKHLFAGVMAAVVSRTVVAPLERLKLEYMVRGARSSVLDIIQFIITTEGLRGFWRGNVVNLLRTAPFKSLNFFCYDTYRKQLLEFTGREEVTNFERLVAGAAAGITATLLCFPMDTIRTKMVAPGGEALGGVVGCFQHMLHTEGFFSLYQGILPAVIAMAPSGAVFYGVYDILKSSYLQSTEGQADLKMRFEVEREKRKNASKLEADLKEAAGSLGQLELGPMRTLLYGAIAGICAETATYPFEVVRRQLQMQNAATRMSTLATCQEIIQRGGLGGLYSGLLPSSLQVLPSAALSYFVYEYMKVILKVP